MHRLQQYFFCALLCVPASCALGFGVHDITWGVSVGGADVLQGEKQLVNIQNSFGNIYTVDSISKSVFLVGVSALTPVVKKQDSMLLSLGVSAYYLSPSNVQGTIFMEQSFPNLSYRFNTQNIPLYATARGVFRSQQTKPISLVLDAGIGPNIIKTAGYEEHSLDAGVSIPNQTFSGSSTVKLSAMAGIGVRFVQINEHTTMELGYKYYYLNEGQLNPRPQVLNHLSTGTINAHALVLTLVT